MEDLENSIKFAGMSWNNFFFGEGFPSFAEESGFHRFQLFLLCKLNKYLSCDLSVIQFALLYINLKEELQSLTETGKTFRLLRNSTGILLIFLVIIESALVGGDGVGGVLLRWLPDSEGTSKKGLTFKGDCTPSFYHVKVI